VSTDTEFLVRVFFLRIVVLGLILASMTFFWVAVLDSKESGLTESMHRNALLLAGLSSKK